MSKGCVVTSATELTDNAKTISQVRLQSNLVVIDRDVTQSSVRAFFSSYVHGEQTCI